MDVLEQQCERLSLPVTRRQVLRGALGAVLLSTGPFAPAQSQSLVDIQREYDVKGAYLYSFTRYIDWPPAAFSSSDDPFVIGVVGEAPIDRILGRIERTKKVGNRPIRVRWYKSAEDYKPCHLLFVVRTIPGEEQRALIQRVSHSHVLVVGETPEFTQWGGIMNFYLNQDTVRFEINVDAAKRENMAINAKLLRIGRAVGD